MPGGDKIVKIPAGVGRKNKTAMGTVNLPIWACLEIPQTVSPFFCTKKTPLSIEKQDVLLPYLKTLLNQGAIVAVLSPGHFWDLFFPFLV